LGARDEWNAKAGALFGGLLKFCIPFLVITPGLIALAKYPDLRDGEQGYALLVKELLPTGIRGLVIAGFLAALMSSVDSIVTSAATIIARDVWVGLLRRTSESRTLLRMGRWLCFALIVFGATTARLSEMFEGIYAAIQSMLSIIQGPTLALLLGGMFSRRATAKAAVVSLVVGIALAVSLHVWQKTTVDDVRDRLGVVAVERALERAEEFACRVESGALEYRDAVEISRGGIVIGHGHVHLLQELEGDRRGRNRPDTRELTGPFALRITVDRSELPDDAPVALLAGDRLVPYTSAAPFNAAEPFFAIAAIAFVVSFLTLIAVSLITAPPPPDALLGLVYRASFHDDDAQNALAERADRLDEGQGPGSERNTGGGPGSRGRA